MRMTAAGKNNSQSRLHSEVLDSLHSPGDAYTASLECNGIEAEPAFDTIPGLRQILLRKPNSVSHWLRLGLAYAENGNGAEAEGAFDRALQIAPRDIGADGAIAAE